MPMGLSGVNPKITIEQTMTMQLIAAAEKELIIKRKAFWRL